MNRPSHDDSTRLKQRRRDCNLRHSQNTYALGRKTKGGYEGLQHLLQSNQPQSACTFAGGSKALSGPIRWNEGVWPAVAGTENVPGP